MGKLRHFFLLLILVSPWVSAMNGIFWQPQLRDNNISQTRWVALMRQLRQQGFDTLVLQWTQYGETFADDAGRQLLQQRAADARQAGLKVIVGLYADPDFFIRQKQRGSALTNYLNQLRVADLRQAQRWADATDGWYISEEIDDLNWRSDATRTALLQWLGTLRQQLSTLKDKPVYISSFFAANMSPDSYRQLIADVHQQGVNLWIQDGLGVRTLDAAERQPYLTASAGCQTSAPASGIVYELFRAIPGKTFRAEPLPARELSAQLAQSPGCDKDRLYFELRYLPAARGILEYQ